MNGKNLLHITALAIGLALATGPVTAGDVRAQQNNNVALQNTCAIGCNNMANTMAGQQTSTSNTTPSEYGASRQTRTEPAYTPKEIRDFHRECLNGCKTMK